MNAGCQNHQQIQLFTSNKTETKRNILPEHCYTDWKNSSKSLWGSLKFLNGAIQQNSAKHVQIDLQMEKSVKKMPKYFIFLFLRINITWQHGKSLSTKNKIFIWFFKYINYITFKHPHKLKITINKEIVYETVFHYFRSCCNSCIFHYLLNIVHSSIRL